MRALARTQRRLERWRAVHSKKARLPDHLKIEACALLKEHSPREIAKTLGISAALFRKWQQVAQGRVGAGPNAKGRRKRVKPVFIDVTPITSRQAVGGTTLTVEIAGRGAVKLAGELSEATVRAAVEAALANVPGTRSEVAP